MSAAPPGARRRTAPALRRPARRDARRRRRAAGQGTAFLAAVELLDPFARQALAGINTHLLPDTGEISATGARTTVSGIHAIWALHWPEQRDAGIAPITLHAYYGAGFHHPHLRGATVGDWPLNVFTPEQAAAELPALRAIATADLHNLVFQRDHRIVPATVAGRGSGTGTGTPGRPRIS
jgi:hypothetical protein